MKEKNPIDELFKQGLEQKELTPSDAVWEKIQEVIEPEESKKGGFYLMRAAVITLFVGLSSWVFLTNTTNGGGTSFGDPNVTGIEIMDNSGTLNTVATNTDETEPKTSTPTEPKKSIKSTKEPIKKRVIKPTMGGTTIKRQRYVANDLDVFPVAAEDYSMQDQELLQAEELQLEKNENKNNFKLRYRVPVTKGTYYADKGTQEIENAPKPKFSERVFAYASDQVGNLISGDPLELPKTDTKVNPQLEISLGSLFNNN